MRLRDRSGMALLLALMVVSFLMAITVQLASSVNWQLQAAYNQSDGVMLEAMVTSGFNIARSALYADGLEGEVDSLQDAWAVLDGEKISALFPDYQLTITVVDLSGLLQVNALVSAQTDAAKKEKQEKQQRELWLRLLTSGKFAIADEEEAETLIDCLYDWIDEDSEELVRGAEKNYYSALPQPYECRNAPFVTPEELLLVKGMTRELFYGDGEHAGLSEYITVAGKEGTINLNTAPAVVLQALAAELTEEMATELIDFRSDEGNREQLASPEWYKQVSGFPGDIQVDSDLLSVRSDYFGISVSATYQKMSKKGRGVLQRDKNHEQRLLYWKVE